MKSNRFTMMMRAVMGMALGTTLALAPAALAQAPTATIHGHVQNAAGIAMSGGEVKLTTESQPTATSTYKFTFPVSSNGDYKGEGITPNTYQAVYFQEGKTVDFMVNQKIAAGADVTIDFDMTRKEFMDHMTPEEKKALEEYKAKNAAASAENAKINNLNTLLKQAREAKAAKEYDKDAELMQQALVAKPDEPLLWFELGDAQVGLKKYDEAVTAYKKVIELNAASKKPKPDLDAAANNNMGQALAQSGKPTDAAAAYEAAAKTLPANAGMYYGNEAAVMFNRGDADNALVAADKAIAADPTRPDPYFIRGQSLVTKATVDEKTGKIVAPPGCVEAYQKYLELAPNGVHAKDVAEVLAGMGETIHSTYKATPATKKK